MTAAVALTDDQLRRRDRGDDSRHSFVATTSNASPPIGATVVIVTVLSATAMCVVQRSLLEAANDEQEYRRVFAALAQEGAEGLVVTEESENVTYRRLIVELAAKGRLPTIYVLPQFVEAGGLISYRIDVSDLGHRVADLADKILKGAKPGEIPIFQPTHFELSINLKTAKTLGIELPPLLVARADNVIE
jgi:putative ABC transport system substrate-binding protein